MLGADRDWRGCLVWGWQVIMYKEWVRETQKRDGRPQRLMTQIRFSKIHSFCCTFKRENELARELPRRLARE